MGKLYKNSKIKYNKAPKEGVYYVKSEYESAKHLRNTKNN